MATATPSLVDHTPGIDAAASAVAVTTATMTPPEINSITDFIVYQAQRIPDTPLIAYPNSANGASDFVDYTAKQLDSFADEAAKELTRQGLRPSVRIFTPADMCPIILTVFSKQRVTKPRWSASWDHPTLTMSLALLPSLAWASLCSCCQLAYRQRRTSHFSTRPTAISFSLRQRIIPPLPASRHPTLSKASPCQIKLSGHALQQTQLASRGRLSSRMRKTLSPS